MSGGHFDYSQYHINTIADSIESKLDRQGKEKPRDELWNNGDYYKQYPEEKFYHTYSKEVQDEMKNAIMVLRKAAIYAQRVDWFLSGDDGEESFLERLKSELDEIPNAGSGANLQN